MKLARRFLCLFLFLRFLQGMGQDASVPTEGLLHWWPDPAEGTDEVTGRRGVRRGFGAVEGNPDVRFGYAAGWVELGPGITNQTFTLSGWMRQSLRQASATGCTIIAQDSGLGTGWVFRTWGTNAVEFASSFPLTRRLYPNRIVLAAWHAFAVRATPNQIELWLDGLLVGTQPAIWARSSEPELLTAGNTTLGSSQWDGDLRDIRLYDRLLSDVEIRSLAASPRSERRDLTAARHPVPVKPVVPGVANPSHYSLHHFTTDHGLLSSEVQCLLQARNGALWLGAEEGLTRFNGRSFWTADETASGFSITGSDVGAIGEDPFGTLWLGMFRGLVSLQGDRWQTHPNIGPARFVRRVLPAGDGTVWLAGYRDSAPRGPMRLRRFDPIADRLRVDVAVPGQVRDLRLATDGVWIGTDEPAALWRFRESTGAVEMVAHLAGMGDATNSPAYPPLPCVRLAQGVPENEVQAEVWQEADGSFQWAQLRLGTNGPVLTWTRNRANSRWFKWEMVEASGDMSLSNWVPAPRGLLYRDGERWKRLALDGMDSEAPVTALAPNAEGGVWAATEGDGLWLIQPHLVRMLTPPEGWGSEEVNSLTRLRDGRLLVGGALDTLTRIDPRFLIPPEVSPFQYAGSLVAEHSDGTLLRIVASNSDDGIFREQGSNQWSYDFVADGRRVLLPEVSQLLASADGSIWIATERSVFHIPHLPKLPELAPGMSLEPPQYSVFLNVLPDQVSLRGLAEAPDSAIWVGSTGAGLFRIFQGQVENFTDPEMLPHNPCVPLGFASDGTLWLGSAVGLGIWRHGQYRWVRPTHGLPESMVCDVEEAEGHLWLAGHRGIHAIPREDLEAFLAGKSNRVSCISLGRSDGLASTKTKLKLQPAMAQTDDGQIWIATARGLAYFHPREVLARLRPPPVALEGLSANGRFLPMGSGPMVLPPGDGRVVEVEFSSLSFVAPERVSFEYELEGPEGKRVRSETAQPRALFTNLKPGRHVFTVKARSGHGLVSDPPARLEFVLQPFFYETPLFIGAAAFAGVSLVGGWLTRRIRRVRRIAALEQERRLADERQRIARDMHDDLGASLTRLAWQAGRLEPSGSTPDSGLLAALVRQVLRSLDEIVWAVNPAKDHLNSVVDYLGTWARDHFAETSLHFTLNLPANVPEVAVSAEWRHHVFLIVKEACSNVLKHAAATEVRCDIALGDASGLLESLEITLRDNGIGFESAAASSPTPPGVSKPKPKLGGNGLGNLRRRASELDAQLAIQSAPGQGTTIRLVVPIPGHSLDTD